MKRQHLIIASLVGLAGLFAIGTSVYRKQRAEDVAALARAHSQLFEPEHAMRMGEPSALVTVVEFFDPACETCAEFAPVLKSMVEHSGGRVQLVERYAPLHPGSDTIAAVLEAARRQDKYWQALDILFATQSQWADHRDPQPDRIWALLQQGGLDLTRLQADMKDPAIQAIIAQDVHDAKSLGVTQTPEFFVNGKPLPTWGMRQLKALVKSELDAKY